MKINWFTLIAQIINFMILVWLMKKYLYKPILDAVAEREKNIKSQLEDAAQKEVLAEKEKTAYQQKNAAFDVEKEELMSKTLAETTAERNKLLEQARQEANAFQEKLQQNIEASQKDLQANFGQKIRQGVVSIASKTLNDLASADLETQIIHTLIEKLKSLKEDELGAFQRLIKSNKTEVVIQTAFVPGESLQKEMIHALEQISGVSPQVSFRSNPELVGGAEVICDGFKLSWNIKEYIQSLEKETESFVHKNTISK